MILDRVIDAVISALWIAWAGYWVIAARATKPTRWREAAGAPALYVIPLLLCAILLAAPAALPAPLRARFIRPGALPPSLGMCLIAAGLGLAAWARRHLGREWSGLVTLKQEHVLIQTGPYQVIRHPIYTGLLLAVIGTAVAAGEWRGVLAIACAAVGLMRKIHAEEALMGRAFPQYATYRKRTKALIPLLY